MAPAVMHAKPRVLADDPRCFSVDRNGKKVRCIMPYRLRANASCMKRTATSKMITTFSTIDDQEIPDVSIMRCLSEAICSSLPRSVSQGQTEASILQIHCMAECIKRRSKFPDLSRQPAKLRPKQRSTQHTTRSAASGYRRGCIICSFGERGSGSDLFSAS